MSSFDIVNFTCRFTPYEKVNKVEYFREHISRALNFMQWNSDEVTVLQLQTAGGVDRTW